MKEKYLYKQLWLRLVMHYHTCSMCNAWLFELSVSDRVKEYLCVYMADTSVTVAMLRHYASLEFQHQYIKKVQDSCP